MKALLASNIVNLVAELLVFAIAQNFGQWVPRPGSCGEWHPLTV